MVNDLLISVRGMCSIPGSVKSDTVLPRHQRPPTAAMFLCSCDVHTLSRGAPPLVTCFGVISRVAYNENLIFFSVDLMLQTIMLHACDSKQWVSVEHVIGILDFFGNCHWPIGNSMHQSQKQLFHKQLNRGVDLFASFLLIATLYFVSC